MENSVRAVCRNCGNEGLVRTYASINVSAEPELKQKVKDGSLFIWECPHCGNFNLAAGQTLYHDPESKLMIWLIPEGAIPPEQLGTVEKHMDRIAEQMTSEQGSGELEGYTLRRVSDAGSLIEKVNIHDAGLDDAVMELCKYVTGMEMAEKERIPEKAAEIADAPFKFYRMEGPDNDILLSFPHEGRMKVVTVGFNVYEDCRGILQRNPSMRPGAGFVKVDNEFFSSRMR